MRRPRAGPSLDDTGEFRRRHAMTIKWVDGLGTGVCGSRRYLNNASKILAGLMCALLVCVFVARSQQNTADILGTVTDTSGAIIPGASVTLTNTGTNISQTTQTNGSGDYTFTLVQVGDYSIKVQASGFKTYVAPSVSVSSGDRARIDAKMEVGTQTQTVEVQATSTPALQTETSNLSTLVTTQAVEDLPLNGRNIVKLIQLSPGISEGTTTGLL